MPKEHKKKMNKGKKRDREAHSTDLENQMEPSNPGQKIYLRLKIQTNPNKIGESSSNIINGESLATTDPEVNSPSNNETIVTSDQQLKNFLRLKLSGPKDVFEIIAERNAKSGRYVTRISEEQEEQSSNDEDEGSRTTPTSNPNFTRIDPIRRQDKRRAYQQSEESRAYQREYQRSYRQNRTNSIPEEIPSWESTRRTYEKSIRQNKVPKIALKNGLHFPEKVTCISELTRLEERLVEPRHTFQQLWTHNSVSGQYKSKGGIVNVPVNVDTTVSCLPRKYNDTETVHVRLARKLCFEKDYIKGNVSPSKVWVGAEYLASTTLYQEYDVSLSDRNVWNERNLNQESDNSNNMGIDEEIDEAEEEDELGYDETFDDEWEEDNVDEPLNIDATDTLIIDNNDNNISIRLAPGEVSYNSMTKSMARRFDRRAVERLDYLLYIKRKNTSSENQPFTAKDVSNDNYVTGLLSKDQAFKTFARVRSSSEY
ncbi:hypothetical protein INT47_007462 [Mucor saturninus]|uniref:DUF6570 domain-containing protein n=1 Tax=Mucor saturninus TaxID=64648 RepID=A0A8H7QKA0_9FUNG|nr:hypothetical protein INT47_007462 [Mucor saturninus]